MADIQHLGPLIRILSSALEQSLSQSLRSYDLTGPQGFILDYLVHNHPGVLNPGDIERQFELSHATVSGILRRLETKGFVTFACDPDDHRRKRIAVTEKARNRAAETRREIEATEQRLTQGMSDEDIAQLRSLLIRAAHNYLGPNTRCCSQLLQRRVPTAKGGTLCSDD